MSATTTFERDVVITPHYLATLAGQDVLGRGGNAVDAMVAANLALGVVAPYYCGYGGDLLAIVHDGEAHGYRSTGRSPAAASIESVTAAGHASMPVLGAHTVTVPGAVRGWFELLERFGTMDFAAVSRRAHELANDGFTLTKPGAFRLAGSIAMVRTLGVDDAALRETYPEVRAFQRVQQPALAKLIDRLATDGPAVYYEGAVGEAIVATLQRLGSAMTMDDLASHRSEWVTPLHAAFADATVLELPPPTQGVTALEMLRIADGCDIPTEPVDRLHLLIEIAKVALADRDAYVGDPTAMRVTPEQMLSDHWIDARRATLDPARAMPVRPRPQPDGGTAYMCCTDANGLSISLIQSNFTAIGSGVHVGEWGINLHNRGSSFRLDAEHPNALDGAKLPMHTLIPGLVLRAGELSHVFGTMGGHAQAQVHLQLLVRMLLDGDRPHEAIDAPRFSVDPSSGAVQFESRVDPTVLAGLRDRGHVINVVRAYDDAMGHAHAIEFLAHGAQAVGADPRAESAALGH